jgi:hypothetical protein
MSCLLRRLLLLLALLGCSLVASAESYRLEVQPRPARLAYQPEGARVTVLVTVAALTGAAVPDGTAIYFHTTLGMLPTVAYTRGGRVEVLLENTLGPGLAIVTATVGDTRLTRTVEFLGAEGADNLASPGPSRTSYRVRARQVYYSIDRRVCDLREGAEFQAASVTIQADALQYDLQAGVVTAQRGVTLSTLTGSVTGEKLRLDLASNQGYLIQVTPEIRYCRVLLPTLTLTEDAVARTADYRPRDPLPTNTWIICPEATIFPGDQIQFRRPEFYLHYFDRRLYKLPYHVLDLRSPTAGTFFNSQISLTSDAGVNVDFPIYYRATAARTGALHLRQVSQGSAYYRGTKGFQVGLEEEYLLGDAGDGGVYLDDLTRDTRSIGWDHRHDFGRTQLSLGATYERYALDTPYTTRVDSTVSHQAGTTDLSLRSNWSAFGESQNTLAELQAYLPARDLGRTGLSLSFTPYLGYTADRDTSPAAPAATDEFYQGMTLGLGVPTLLTKLGALSTTLTNEVTHSSSGEVKNYFDVGLTFRRPLTRQFVASLGYAFSDSYSSTETATPTAQRLNLDLSGSRAQAWNLFAFATYDLKTRLLYSSATTTLYLPWDRTPVGTPRWYLRYRTNLSSGASAVTDQMFTLAREVGAYTIQVHYSPTGNTATTGIGTGSGKHWAVQLTRAGW